MLRLPDLDDRSWSDLVEEARALIPTIQPDWTDHNPSDPGIALVELFAWLTEMVIYRLNELPDENYWTFLKLIHGADVDRSQGLEEMIRSTVLDLRACHRAVTPQDYEVLALEQWPSSTEAAGLGWRRDVGRVRCVPERNLEAGPGAEAPGHVSLVVMPKRPVLRFDGNRDALACAIDPYLRLTGDLTVSGWIRPDNVAKGYQPLVARGAELAVILQDTGLISFRHGADLEGATHPAMAAATGRWCHFAITRSVSERMFTFYLNGAAVGTAPYTDDPAGDTGPLYVAGTPESTCNFEGRMIDVCVWRRVRSAAEIAADLSTPPIAADRDLAAALSHRSSPGWGTLAGIRLDDPALFGPVWIRDPHDSLLQGLKRFLDLRRLVTTRTHVVGPGYVEISVEATLYLRLDADLTAVGARADASIRGLIDLVAGGRDGRGWPFGRSLYLSDLYTALEGVEGVDFVRGGRLAAVDPGRALYQAGESADTEGAAPFGLRVGPHELPVIRSIRLRLMESRRGEWREVTE